jgi:glutamyl-tRNA reductase
LKVEDLHDILNEIQHNIKQEDEEKERRVKEYQAQAEKIRNVEEETKRRLLESKRKDSEILEKHAKNYLEKLFLWVISIFIVDFNFLKRYIASSRYIQPVENL